MRKLRHSKIKNTGLLFELLAKQIAIDTLKGNEVKSLELIKKYFKDTELGKELEIYRVLAEEKFRDAEKAKSLIDSALKIYDKMNKNIIKKQKYSLIKEIKDSYDVKDFFGTKVDKYRIFASIYKLLEHVEISNPVEFVEAKYTILEHIVSTSPSVKEVNPILKQEKDMRLIILKIMTDKFNSKYSSLSDKQKNLIKEYIKNITSQSNLKKIILTEIIDIKKQLTKFVKLIDDKSTRIKLQGITKLLDNINENKKITENDISNILVYYEIIDELKNIIKE